MREARVFFREFLDGFAPIAELSLGRGASLGARLASTGLAQPYVFFSSQELRAKRLLLRIRESLSLSTDAVFYFFADSLSSTEEVRRLDRAVKLTPLDAKVTMVVVYRIEALPKTSAKRFLSILESAQNSNSLIFLSGNTPSKCRFVDKLSKKTLVKFEDFNRQTLLKWLLQEAREREIQVEKAAALSLLRHYGEDLYGLSCELSKLSLAVGPGGNVDLSKLEEMSHLKGEASNFLLLEAIAKGKTTLACQMAVDLMADGQHPLQILKFLGNCFLSALESRESGGGAKTGGFFLQKLEKSFRNFPRGELIRTIDTLRRLDFELKDSPLEPRTLLLDTIWRISCPVPGPHRGDMLTI